MEAGVDLQTIESGCVGGVTLKSSNRRLEMRQLVPSDTSPCTSDCEEKTATKTLKTTPGSITANCSKTSTSALNALKYVKDTEDWSDTTISSVTCKVHKGTSYFLELNSCGNNDNCSVEVVKDVDNTYSIANLSNPQSYTSLWV